jgi:hypothetical protein
MYLGFWVDDVENLKLPPPNYIKKYGDVGCRCIWHIVDFAHNDKEKTINYLNDIAAYAIIAHKGAIIDRFIPKLSDIATYTKNAENSYYLKDLDIVSKEFKTRINRANNKAVKLAQKANETNNKKGLVIQIAFLYCYAFARLNLICEFNFYYLLRNIYRGVYGKQIKQDKAVKEKMIEVLTERANAYKAHRLEKERVRVSNRRWVNRMF